MRGWDDGGRPSGRPKLRLLAFACLACLVAAFIVGCGDDDDSSSGSTAASTTAEKPVKVAAILAALDNDFYVAQKEGIEAAAKEMPGVDVTVSAGSKREASTEVVSLIEDAIAKSPDAIMVNGSEDDPLLPALKQVIAAGIPLILFDAPAPTLKGQYKAYIGTDNFAGGKADGEWLAEHLPNGGKIGAILCVAGHPVTVARFKGFKEGLGDPSKYKIVATGDATCDTTKSRNIMEDMITAHPDLDAVFSTSDTQSIAAVPALEAAKKDPLFVSFDAQPDAVKLITEGKVLDASAAWSAKQLGGDALKAAVAAARKEPVTAEQMIPTTVVDKTNAASWNG
jgi:ribose transport system substrate-binding protein